MKLLTSFAIATTLSAPAFAGGLTEPVAEPVIVPVAIAVPVSADWTGFYAGAQLGYGDANTDVAGVEGNGAFGGIHGGYRYDFGQFVAGAELAYNGSDIDLGTTGKLDDLTQLKFTAGYDLGKTLVYGTVGASYANATVGGVEYNDTGYVFGVGMDYAINDKWTVGGELARNSFDNFDGTGLDAGGNTAQIRVGYRF
jgi:opacity protein-like surface antigen